MNRFQEYIQQRHIDLFHRKYEIDPESGCWIWQSNAVEQYGKLQLTHKPSRKVAAHRFSAWIHGMPVTDDIYVCHHCDTPRCVNPEHLFLGTARDNARDRTQKGRNFTQHGEDNPASKLTESAVRHIRSLEKPCVAELSEQYGVTQSTIYRVLRRECWRHVE